MWQHLYDAPVSTLRDPSPSPEDIVVTRKLVEAGELLDVGVLDHIIIGRQSFVSLRDRGIGFD